MSSPLHKYALEGDAMRPTGISELTKAPGCINVACLHKIHTFVTRACASNARKMYRRQLDGANYAHNP